MENIVSWDATPCNVIAFQRYFGLTCCPNRQCGRWRDHITLTPRVNVNGVTAPQDFIFLLAVFFFKESRPCR
jgi:hypothetical protein